MKIPKRVGVWLAEIQDLWIEDGGDGDTLFAIHIGDMRKIGHTAKCDECGSTTVYVSEEKYKFISMALEEFSFACDVFFHWEKGEPEFLDRPIPVIETFMVTF